VVQRILQRFRSGGFGLWRECNDCCVVDDNVAMGEMAELADRRGPPQ
jgi:hypothetical protein